MATIGIKSIRINSVSVSRNDKGEDEITAEYALISTADKVLAKQSISKYGMEIKPSPQTLKALESFVSLYRQDIQALLGLDAE